MLSGGAKGHANHGGPNNTAYSGVVGLPREGIVVLRGQAPGRTRDNSSVTRGYGSLGVVSALSQTIKRMWQSDSKSPRTSVGGQCLGVNHCIGMKVCLV